MAAAAKPSAGAAAAGPSVRIEGLRKSFGSNEVLKGIDLMVQPGEVLAIIGKSGSGKSTLLRCINGLETFQHGALQHGALQLDGQALKHGDAKAMRALRRHVGMVFQSFNLFPHLSVGQNVMLAPRLVKQTDISAAGARARKVADRIVFMHAGRIHEMGPPAALFGNPQTAELKQFLSALH